MDHIAPIAKTAYKLTGPKWADACGSHVITFHRIIAGYGGRDFNGWQMVDHCNGQVFQVVDMPDTLADVCDTATGALWALRGIAAHWARSDVRSTRGH